MGNSFQYDEHDDGIGLLTLDVADKSVNTFARPVVEELAQVIEELEKRSDLRGLLFRSGKPGQFIAGADLKELGALAYASKDQVKLVLDVGHALFNRFSQLPFPTVALIDGNSMGGGTELALSMDDRIASNARHSKIGLPEVKVGLIPGWGGTQRLPRLIGVHHAIDMICGGEPVDAVRAAELGLVFDVVPSERLIDEGRRLIDDLQETGEWLENRNRRRQPLGLSEDQMHFTFGVAEGKVQSVTKGQYPAPMAALTSIKQGINLPLAEALEVEKKVALELTGGPISANLINVFFMTTRLARDRGVENPDVQARKIERVGVLGAGQMGAGIATAHARSGIPSAMVDVDNDRVALGLEQATGVVAGRIKIGRATPADMQQMLAHLSTATSHSAFAECDVVVEAITENEKLKTDTYKQLANVLRPNAILASNTSTISITRMAESAPEPERFVGMHFFFPVDRMSLVEVIRGEKTSDETVVTIVELAKRIRKTPIVVNDCPGFLVNRILLPYMSESIVMLLEGAPMDQIDSAAIRFGMPVGPIALHDMVGLDTACFAGRVLTAAYKDRAVETPLLEQLVEAGRLGKKTGKGFRRFEGRKGLPVADPDFESFLEQNRTDKRQLSDEEICDRLFLCMLLEAVRTLEEGIVREPMHVDMGLILGIGFPPFRGGILRWCDSEGPAEIVERASKFAKLGKRYEPTALLKNMAASGDLFYPRAG